MVPGIGIIGSAMGPRKTPLSSIRTAVVLYTDHQALDPLIERSRCYNKQYSARLTNWLDRLALFDIALQHMEENYLESTNFLNKSPVKNAAVAYTTKNT